jgi:hypothetical protein
MQVGIVRDASYYQAGEVIHQASGFHIETDTFAAHVFNDSISKSHVFDNHITRSYQAVINLWFSPLPVSTRNLLCSIAIITGLASGIEVAGLK